MEDDIPCEESLIESGRVDGAEEKGSEQLVVADID